MPIFELQGPDGKTYEVEAPDMRAAASAFGSMAGPGVGDMSVRNVATAAARGVPILGGMVDEAVAGAQSMFGSGSYEDNLKAEQARQAAFDRQNPWTSGAAQVAGGVAGTIPMIMAAPGFFGAGAAGLAARAGMGALSGAVVGGADQAVRSNGDLGEAAKGAAVGGAFGLAAPLAGKVAGKAFDAAADFVGRPTSALGGVSPQAAQYAAKTLNSPVRQAETQAQLQALGPDAMLADVSPEWAMIARGAAARPDNREIIINTLLGRDAGKNARLGADLNSSLGKVVAPSAVTADIKAGQEALGPAYGRAFDGARAVDTENIANALDGSASILRGPAQKATNQVRGMLDVPGTNTLDPNPSALFQTRQAIDGLLATEQNPQVIRQLAAARAQIDDTLANAVPGIKGVDAQYSELARQGEGLQRGSQVFDSGKTAIRPSDLAQEFPAAALPQGQQVGPSAVPFRVQQGARAEVDRIVGQSANDPAALQRAMRGEGDWNRDKLRTVFGNENADKALGAIDRETTFYRTKNRIESGSDTGATQGFREFLDRAATPNAIPMEATVAGMLMRGGQRLLGGASQGAAIKRAEQFAGELGRLSIAQGSDRDQIVKTIIDIITQQQGRAPTTQAVERATNALVRSGGMLADR